MKRLIAVSILGLNALSLASGESFFDKIEKQMERFEDEMKEMRKTVFSSFSSSTIAGNKESKSLIKDVKVKDESDFIVVSIEFDKDAKIIKSDDAVKVKKNNLVGSFKVNDCKISFKISDGVFFTISSEFEQKEEKKDEKDKRDFKSYRTSMSEQIISLPCRVANFESGKVSAEFKDSTFVLTLPKAEGSGWQKIDIK